MKCRSFITLFSTAVLAAGTISPALAQDYRPEYASGDRDYRSDGGYDNDAARRWDRFLDEDSNRDFGSTIRTSARAIPICTNICGIIPKRATSSGIRSSQPD
jgi:hypothetical protein